MQPDLPDDARDAIDTALYAGRKIDAIKQYREATGGGLKEAKEAVEVYEAELRARHPQHFTKPPARAGCTTAILLTATLATAAALAALA